MPEQQENQSVASDEPNTTDLDLAALSQLGVQAAEQHAAEMKRLDQEYLTTVQEMQRAHIAGDFNGWLNRYRDKILSEYLGT